MYPYDLHCHSSFSDGDFDVSKVIQKAKEAGLKGLAITDHNVIDHIKLAETESEKAGLTNVEGVEITSSFQSIDIHILGYSLGFDLRRLQQILKPIQDGYNERARIIIRKLKQSIGIELDFDSLVASRPAGVVFRYNIAQAIDQKQNIPLNEAQRLIGRNGPAWEPYGEWVPKPEQVVEGIHKANGIAVIAHPGDIKRSGHNPQLLKKNVTELITTLVKVGLDGIEVRHSSHGTEEEQYFGSLAQKYDLIESGGSDWHGEIHHPEIAMGMSGLTQSEFDHFVDQLRR